MHPGGREFEPRQLHIAVGKVGGIEGRPRSNLGYSQGVDSQEEAAYKAAMTDKHSIADAARNFVRLIKEADEKTLDEAFQVLASDANASPYAASLEPMQAMCSAVMAEYQRRTFLENDSNGDEE